MTRWLWWMPFTALVLLAGVIGYQFGRAHTPLNETQVISRVVNAHLQDRGGRVEDCFAVPGAGEIWLQVVCAGTVYKVDRQGRVIAVEETGA